MDDERAGTPPSGGDPAPEHEPQEMPREDPDHPAADPRTTIAGRYAVDLQSLRPSAGIAVAYEGRDLRTRDPVVVKTLRLEYRGDPEMRARFRREARLLQFLSHPNVIRALAFTEERGAPWLVLERVRGRSLREEIDDGRTLRSGGGRAAAARCLPRRSIICMRGDWSISTCGRRTWSSRRTAR